MEYTANHLRRAHALVGEMLSRLKEGMLGRGLGTLRIEGSPRIIVYLPDPVLDFTQIAELVVQGVCLVKNEDGGCDLVLRTAPPTDGTGVRIVNGCVTGKDVPDIDPDDEYGDCVRTDDDGVDYLSLLELDEGIAEAFALYDGGEG